MNYLAVLLFNILGWNEKISFILKQTKGPLNFASPPSEIASAVKNLILTLFKEVL